MLHISFLCIGRMRENYLRQAAADYQQRLGRLCRFDCVELSEYRLPDAPSPAQIAAALEQEADAILRKIPKGAYVIPLCIEGQALSSLQLAACFTRVAVHQSGGICLLIGSSYGLSERVKQRGNLRLSLSAMTFPHQLARVMALEQVYRALKIAAGQTYHK